VNCLFLRLHRELVDVERPCGCDNCQRTIQMAASMVHAVLLAQRADAGERHLRVVPKPDEELPS
jgi:hypothetical protein